MEKEYLCIVKNNFFHGIEDAALQSLGHYEL